MCSAIKGMRTRRKRRPDPLLVFTCLSSSLRSSSVTRTRYHFAGICPLLVDSLHESVPLFTLSGKPRLFHYLSAILLWTKVVAMPLPNLIDVYPVVDRSSESIQCILTVRLI